MSTLNSTPVLQSPNRLIPSYNEPGSDCCMNMHESKRREGDEDRFGFH